MHGLVAKQALRDAIAVSDLLEVERRMVALIEITGEKNNATPNTASAAATYRLKTGGQKIRARAADSFAIGYQIHDDLLDVQADTTRGASMPVINIVQVLQSSHAASVELPCQAGRLLQPRAIERHTRLTGRCLQ